MLHCLIANVYCIVLCGLNDDIPECHLTILPRTMYTIRYAVHTHHKPFQTMHVGMLYHASSGARAVCIRGKGAPRCDRVHRNVHIPDAHWVMTYTHSTPCGFFFPSFLLSFFPSFLHSFLPSFLHSFFPSFFVSSFLLFVLPSPLPSSCMPSFLYSFLTSVHVF